MTTLSNTLNEILSENKIPDAMFEKIKEKHEAIRVSISQALGARTLLIGSYKKKTAIKDFNDVDVLIWMPKDFLDKKNIDEIQKEEPRRCLNKLKRELKDLSQENPNLNINEVKLQNHSIGISFSDVNFTMDLIPAFSVKDPNDEGNFRRKFVIPEKETARWIYTNPEHNRDLLVKANEKSKKKVIPLIRLLKIWRNTLDRKSFKSFHIESLIVYLALKETSIFHTPISSSLFEVFYNAVDKIKSIIDKKIDISTALELPQNPAAYFDEEPSRYEYCKRKLNHLRNDLEEIRKLSENNETDTAIEKLKNIFDTDGNTSSVTVIGSRKKSTSKKYTRVSPDAPDKRFGYWVGK